MRSRRSGARCSRCPGWRRVVESRLEEWRRLLRGSTAQARAVLQRVLRGRLTFTPNGSGYHFAGPTRFDKLFSGVACPRPSWMPNDRTGCDDVALDDTPDGDYGRLLERVFDGKGVRPQREPRKGGRCRGRGFTTAWRRDRSSARPERRAVKGGLEVPPTGRFKDGGARASGRSRVGPTAGLC
jgi:hypothetical protein